MGPDSGVKSIFHPNEFRMTKPGSKDLMKITVNDDGTIRVDTPGIISQLITQCRCVYGHGGHET